MTTIATVGRLGLKEGQWSMSYQSRLGPAKWLTPATSSKVVELAEQGVRRLVIVSPAFVADGLETLEELEQEVRDEFIEAGGEDVKVISCLNDNADWIHGLGGLIQQAFKQGEPVSALHGHSLDHSLSVSSGCLIGPCVQQDLSRKALEIPG
jgi:ferrochelatase